MNLTSEVWLILGLLVFTCITSFLVDVSRGKTNALIDGTDNYFTWLERSGVDVERVKREMLEAWNNQDTYYHRNRG